MIQFRNPFRRDRVSSAAVPITKDPIDVFNETFKEVNLSLNTYSKATKVDSIRCDSLKIEEVSQDDSILNLVAGTYPLTFNLPLIAREISLPDCIEWASFGPFTDSDSLLQEITEKTNDNKEGVGSKIVIISDESSAPLSVFTCDNLSIESAGVKFGSTILIDGKRVFTYKCRISIYSI